MVLLSSRSDHGHRRRGTRDEHGAVVLVMTVDVGLAEMQGPARLHDTSHGTQTASASFREVADLQLGRDRMLIGSYERESGEACGDVGDRGGDATVDEAYLLPMDDVEIDLGFDVARFDHCQPAVDVLHEFLAFEMRENRLAEVGVQYRKRLHDTKIRLPYER